jgi:hypothetical protein
MRLFNTALLCKSYLPSLHSIFLIVWPDNTVSKIKFRPCVAIGMQPLLQCKIAVFAFVFSCSNANFLHPSSQTRTAPGIPLSASVLRTSQVAIASTPQLTHQRHRQQKRQQSDATQATRSYARHLHVLATPSMQTGTLECSTFVPSSVTSRVELS